MNKTYRVVWSKERGAMMAVNEITMAMGKGKNAVAVAVATAIMGITGATAMAAEPVYVNVGNQSFTILDDQDLYYNLTADTLNTFLTDGSSTKTYLFNDAGAGKLTLKSDAQTLTLNGATASGNWGGATRLDSGSTLTLNTKGLSVIGTSAGNQGTGFDIRNGSALDINAEGKVDIRSSGGGSGNITAPIWSIGGNVDINATNDIILSAKSEDAYAYGLTARTTSACGSLVSLTSSSKLDISATLEKSSSPTRMTAFGMDISGGNGKHNEVTLNLTFSQPPSGRLIF